MTRKILSIFVSILFKLIFYKKKIKVDLLSNLNYKNLSNNKLIGSKKYPILIKNSIVGKIQAQEGCKLLNANISHNVKLGKFVSINGPGTRIAAYKEGIEIGSYSSIASNVVIQEYYHRYNRITSYYFFQNIMKESVSQDIYSKGKIIIEEDVWIGSNCVILSGVTIGRGSVIAAGSIITKNIPRYSIVAGNPGKVIKQRFENKNILLLERLEWWKWDTQRLLDNNKIFSIEDSDLLFEELQKLA